MIERIKSFFRKDAASSQLTPVETPKKLKRNGVGIPSYLKSATPDKSQAIRKTERNVASTDIARTARNLGTKTIVRDLSKTNSDLSAAKFTYLRTAITKRYSAVARNLDSTINPEATSLVQQLITRFDLLPDYNEGFTGTSSIRSLAEIFAGEIIIEGAACAELVLDKTLIPARIKPLSASQIEFKPDGDGFSPIQKVGGDEIDLNIPTFFYVALDQDPLDAYASSMVESAIKPIFFLEQFAADVERIVRRQIHPRMVIEIDEESFRKYVPQEYLVDGETFKEYYDSVIDDVQELINGLEPEDALVMSNIMKFRLENNGNISLAQEYETLQAIGNARMTSGAKVMPSMLGISTGSQNIASTETLVFMKSAEGAIQLKLNELFSRILTLAVRIFGHDVVVNFEFEAIALRPESELEAFRQTQQSRILEQLSYGFLSDEEASIMLTGKLPPPSFQPLSGTRFLDEKSGEDESDTGLYGGSSNNGSTLNQKVAPKTPSTARGKNNTNQANKRKNNG